MKFRVIDKKTGKEADTWNIALHEEWAQGLVYCDMEGFAITEDGYLVLMDECGHVVYCDAERFKVVFEDARPHGEWEKYGDKIEAYDIEGHKTWGQKRRCTNCGFVKTYIEDFGFYLFCPSCSASMSANDRQVTGKLDDNTTLLYSMTNGDNFIGKEGEASDTNSDNR